MKRPLHPKRFNHLRNLILLTLFVSGIHFPARTQTANKTNLNKNTLYAEYHAGIFSHVTINYERLLFSGDKVKFYNRFGLGYGNDFGNYTGLGALKAVTLLTGKKNNHLEIDAGVFVGTDHTDYYDSVNQKYSRRTILFIMPVFNLGYRFQKPDGGFLFKATVGIIGIGIGLGYSF